MSNFSRGEDVSFGGVWGMVPKKTLGKQFLLYFMKYNEHWHPANPLVWIELSWIELPCLVWLFGEESKQEVRLLASFEGWRYHDILSGVQWTPACNIAQFSEGLGHEYGSVVFEECPLKTLSKRFVFRDLGLSYAN